MTIDMGYESYHSKQVLAQVKEHPRVAAKDGEGIGLTNALLKLYPEGAHYLEGRPMRFLTAEKITELLSRVKGDETRTRPIVYTRK